MRCILVNDAHLKAGAYCTYCGKKIGDSYIREIGSRFLYCDFACYEAAAAASALVPRAPVLPVNSWTLGS